MATYKQSTGGTHPTPRASRGFTLLEMLIVVGIVAIVVAFGFPRISAIMLRQRTDRATYIVASDLRSAFTSSARGRVPVQVLIPGDTNAYTVTNQITNTRILRRTFASDRIPVNGQTNQSVTMMVYPNGVATGIDTIVVGTAAYKRLISVSRVGFVRVIP